MLDHVGLRVSDFQRSKRFYSEALAAIGYRCLMEDERSAGFGMQDKPDFWISAGEPVTRVHLAFVGSRAQVDAFHTAALQAGGHDFGTPGIRSQYHPHYYGAFVLDPDGNNIEVVCHEPEK